MLIEVPTGLGKTGAVVLAWLWNRVLQPDEKARAEWPRRLVYCLPMRTLVEQTQREVRTWLLRLARKHTKPRDGSSLRWLALHSPIILMGGEERTDWDIHPEHNAILIGTQDMLLSRALNRGYGMSRYRWPMHFGLLNNDCLWVLDETQLMGPGVGTAAQLEAFRRTTSFGSLPGGRSVTWYASATASADHLITREWRNEPRPVDFKFELSDDEKAATTGQLAQRRLAWKSIQCHRSDWNFGDKQVAGRADEIIRCHREMITQLDQQEVDEKAPRRTLVICNTVNRAVAVHDALEKKLGSHNIADLMLMHSRFRQEERETQSKRLRAGLPRGGQIIVATQVIEAGVDLSSAILWSEIAPLASLMQRLGRLNRAGEFGFGTGEQIGFVPQAIIVGLDLPTDAGAESTATKKQAKAKKQSKPSDDLLGKQRKCYLPYDMDACDEAWKVLRLLANNASPAAFESVPIAREVAASIPTVPYSLQRHELLDFFDTDANLSLGFTDVSPFVRGTDAETDFYVLWRDWDGSKPDHYPDYQHQELCPVSIGKTKSATALLNKGWLWRGKETGWISVRDVGVVPGMTILLPSSAGGYSIDKGWTGSDADKPVSDLYEPGASMSDEEMLSILENGWRSIAAHTKEVKTQFSEIIKALPDDLFTESEHSSLERGIDWHDVGKNHPDWQQAAKDALVEARMEIDPGFLPLAKFSLSESPTLRNPDGNLKFSGRDLKREINILRRRFKPGIAHEVASALAFRQHEQAIHGTERSFESLLAEYLIMSHHGHVRKVLRDELPKNPTAVKDANTVRGICNGDELPAVSIGDKFLGCTSLSTDCRRMGRDTEGHESYTRGVLRLLNHYGPFRLAFFEALFRVADIRASILAQNPSNA